MVKETIIKMKREPTIWENIFLMIHQTRVKSPKYIKNSYDSARKTNNPTKKWART